MWGGGADCASTGVMVTIYTSDREVRFKKRRWVSGHGNSKFALQHPYALADFDRRGVGRKKGRRRR